MCIALTLEGSKLKVVSVNDEARQVNRSHSFSKQ